NRAVIPSRKKELHYFDNRFSDRRIKYRADFCRKSALVELSSRLAVPCMTGEATPFYMFHPEVAQRMKSIVPRTKIIVILRDPAVRAYSHYMHERRRGSERLSFVDAVDAEPERLAEELETWGSSAFDDPNSMQRHASYVSRGQYGTQLARIYEHFP